MQLLEKKIVKIIMSRQYRMRPILCVKKKIKKNLQSAFSQY